MADPIDTFIDSYLRELDFYQEAARLCAQQCEKLLDVNGIRAMVTFRAKRPDRLREKLLKRDADKKYASVEDIRSDIVDLAGVRVALYFPADRPRFGKLVSEAFGVLAVKDFPEPTPPRPGKRFSGYHATHYRIRLRTEDIPEPQKRYGATPIEIQVASLLMHAWSEVEHDLVYKPASGELSEDEYAILDELNGLVLSGEIALERLQRALEIRVSKRDEAFANHYELAAFVFEEAKSTVATPEANEPIMGRVDVLLELLRTARLDAPAAVRPYLEGLDDDAEARPIADQIADRVLAAHPDLYKPFLEMKASAGQRDPYLWSEPQEGLPPDLIGGFLSRWITFERFTRMVVRQRFPERRRWVMGSTRELREFLGSNADVLGQIDYLRDLRNHLVHGVRIPDASTLKAAIETFDRVFAILDASENPTIKAAIRWARSGDEEPDSMPA